jgi:hypothetical protein
VIIIGLLSPAFALVPAAASESPREYSDISVLSQTDREIVFSYKPLAHVWIADRLTGSQVLDIDKCAYNLAGGEPKSPVRIVLIGIPGTGRAEASLVSASYASIEPQAIAVNKIVESSIADNVAAQVRRSKATYEPLHVIEPYFIRDQRVLEVHLMPVQIAPPKTATAVATELLISVRFDAGQTKQASPSSDDSFDRALSASLLNFDQAKQWRVGWSRTVQGVQSGPFGQAPIWLRIGVNETGIYRITPSQLEQGGINVGSVDPRTLRLFWAGCRQLPESNSKQRPEFRELPIVVTGESDGSFNSGDHLLFYMHGADFVDIDSTMNRPVGVRNHYSSAAYVWLTFGGDFADTPKRMGMTNVSPDASEYVLHETFDQMTHFEEDKLLEVGLSGHISDYYSWYWHDDGNYSMSIQIDNLPSFAACSLLVKSIDTGTEGLIMNINNVSYSPSQYIGNLKKFDVTNLRNGINSFEFHQSRYIFTPLLDYFELFHPRVLTIEDAALEFYTHNTPGVHRYRITSSLTSSSQVVLLHVTDVDNPSALLGFSVSGGNIEFDWENTGSHFERFAVSSLSQLLAPVSIQAMSPRDLRTPLEGDIVVIAPKSLSQSLDEYSAFREGQGYSVEVVSVEDIYANFSGGLVDPIAIRDFLKYNFETSPSSPGAVLLVGDGHYDFRNNLGRSSVNHIPPYVVDGDFSVSDENYAVFGVRGILDSDSSYGTDRGVDMMVARWPVRTESEVAAYIGKLKSYESPDTYGPWRNLVTLVADDEFKSEHSKTLEAIHTIQSEILANEHLPAEIDVQKIYLTDYPFDSFNQKPRARARVIQAINDGSVLINYIGHGSPDLWADERAFYWKEDLYQLTNRDKLSVVFNASCSIGQFDSPLREAMAEELFRYADGGAIATVAATRLVFSDDNAKFAYKAFDVMFGDEPYTLCEAVFVAKLLRQIPVGGPIDNDRSYVVFGDPLMCFGMPARRIVIDSLSPSSLAALATTSVGGHVEVDGSVEQSFNGEVYVTVYDAERDKQKDLGGGFTLEYSMPGPRVFRGAGQITGGEFQMSFIVPKDISYGESSARVLAYAASATAQVSGGIGSVEISGSNPSITDTTGPSIELRFVSGAPFEGGSLSTGGRLLLELNDTSGVNLSGEVGHGIIVSFDDDPLYDVDLTDQFVYYASSYRSGQAEFSVPDLPSGSHKMTVKAWDSANNSGMRVYDIFTGERPVVSITAIMNYPNPASEDTRFSYCLSEQMDDVSVNVFTLRGRLVRTLRSLPSSPGYNISPAWDVTDFRGDRLANGVYIYRITASGSQETEGAGSSVQGFGKLVVMR